MRKGRKGRASEVGREKGRRGEGEKGAVGVLATSCVEQRKGKERKGGRERGHTLRSFSGVQDCGHDR